MWKMYRDIIREFPKISLQEELRLIRAAKKCLKPFGGETFIVL